MMRTEHDSAQLAINDRIFLGEGLFETIKVRNAKPCFANLHWQRLYNSAQDLGLSFTLSAEGWYELLLQKILQAELVDGGLKVILSGGVAPRGLVAQGQDNQLLLQGFSFPSIQKPVHLRTASWLRDVNNPLYQLKTINYLEAIIARREAMEYGADDALFFNTQECVTEASCANIFFLHRGRVLTPPQTDGVLPGITRFRVLNHCRHSHIDHAEVSITKEIMSESEAIFLTNSLQGIHTVSSVDKREFAKNHPLIGRLIDLLAEEEKRYCFQ